MITEQQRANILDALHNMWPSVPPENVQPELSLWREYGGGDEPPTCGAVACFGGWCAWWPAFQTQGIRARSDGEPVLDTPRYTRGFSVAEVLFGDALLFAPRDRHPADEGGEDLTDHQIVTRRLESLL